MKVQSVFLATALAVAMISGACNSSSIGSSGTGGSSSTGGTTGTGGSSSGTGGGASCPNVTACGGNVVGTWNVSSSCLTLSDSNVDISLAGLDPRSCTNVTISGSLAVTGTFTAKSDTTYTDGTTTTGTAQVKLPAGCLMISGTTTTCEKIGGPFAGGLGFANMTCTEATDGGCNCTATINQQGGLGWVSASAQTSGNFATSGNTLTNDSTTTYSYCVSGNQLTLTPTPASPSLTGAIVLQMAGTTSTGGTTGTGGTSSTGGTTGTGGTSATGGAGGKGGTGGMAGAKGTGGMPATGGTTGTGGTPATGGTTGTGGTTTAADGPCDIYTTAGQPCAAAYSMIRVLSKGYTGPLYQVRSGSSAMNTGSGGTTKDIGSVNGFADTATQDAFCTGTTCTVSLLYDQTGNGNALQTGSPGGTAGGTYSATTDFESSATKKSLTVGGHKVYALYMNAREGYRTPLGVKGKNVPLGNVPEGIYELADGTHTGTACCWDFGNVSPDPKVYVTMNTIFFGTGFWGSGAGSGPWFMGDFEGGVWAGGTGASTTNNPSNPSMKVPYALGILHTPVGKYALRMADVSSASDLTTAYDGTIPSGKTWGNAGAIVLGVGGDNSNNSMGTFYEGAVTIGSPTNATDLLIMQNIQAAGYGK
jgi:hypothetical protein